MSFVVSVLCGSVVAVLLVNVFAKPTSCWVGTDQGNFTNFSAWNCSSIAASKFCFTVAFTDPAVIQDNQFSTAKGCDDATHCTKNGVTKLADRDVYCCDKDYCNDLACDRKGECTQPIRTTTSPTEATTKGSWSLVINETLILLVCFSAASIVS